MKRSLAIVAGALGALWLISVGVLLFYIAGLAGVPLLLAAVVCQIAVFLVAAALLLVTNTRRPAGIDPNAPPLPIDPYGDTTDGLMKHAIMLPDRKPYGRRAADDTAVVQRLIDRLEKDDAARPAPAQTPQWALDLQANEPHAASADQFADGQEEEG